MARPKKFDRDEALTKAIRVFWEYGYDATSMTDLQKALGIGRQSLYTTFGDKDQLFEEALSQYVAMADHMLAQRLGDDAGFDDIRRHMLTAAKDLTAMDVRTGCLMMNTCVDRAPHDPKIAEITQRGLEASQRVFAAALTRARRRGELGPNGEIRAIARFLTSQMAGMSVLSRAGASTEELLQIAETALASVERMMK